MIQSTMGSSSIAHQLNNNQDKGVVAPMVIVVMGVSGSGKSTVGELLAKTMECSFLDADNFHPQSNIEKMSKGIPLTDEDRKPWLETLRDTLRNKTNLIMSSSSSITSDAGKSKKNITIILCCSALQKSYREILRTADPNYKPGSYIGGRVKFVCLEVPMEVIANRVKSRAEEGNHFMPPSLLQSQLDLLQIDPIEKDITVVDATLSPQVIVQKIQSLIF